MELILLLFACFGLTSILVHGSILNWFRILVGKIPFFGPRFLTPLLKCSMCTGLWVGLFLAWLLFEESLFMMIGLPFASSGFCWFLDRLTVYLDDHIYELNKEEEDKDDNGRSVPEHPYPDFLDEEFIKRSQFNADCLRKDAALRWELAQIERYGPGWENLEVEDRR